MLKKYEKIVNGYKDELEKEYQKRTVDLAIEVAINYLNFLGRKSITNTKYIEDYLNNKDISIKSRLSKFYDYLYFNNYINDKINFKKLNIKSKSYKKSRIYITEKDVDKIENSIRKDSSKRSIKSLIAVELLFFAGLGISELRKLKLENIEKDHIIIDTGERARYIPIPVRSRNILQEYISTINNIKRGLFPLFIFYHFVKLYIYNCIL